MTDRSSSGIPLRVTRGQATWRTDKSSPGTPLGVTRGQATWWTDKPSPGTPLRVTRGQATWCMHLILIKMANYEQQGLKTEWCR